MSATDKQLTQDKAVVDAYYQAAVRGELITFGQYVHPDFVTTAPNYLPWGGTHLGAAWFRDNVLAHLQDDLDFSHFTYESLWLAATAGGLLLHTMPACSPKPGDHGSRLCRALGCWL